MKRTKLCDRKMPVYTRAEELTNTITHVVGGVMGIVFLVLCVTFSAFRGDGFDITSSVVYGVSLVMLYTVSSVYHGLPAGMGKRVMQVLDHCTIYLLIAGTYTVIALGGIRKVYPALGWGMFAFEWLMAAIAITLTAIDLKAYEVFSMTCYIGMGWAIIPFARQTYVVLTRPGFLLLLWGGIAYTIGAVLYGIGSKKRWMHSVFHVFVLIGTLLQFLATFLYVL